MAAAQRSPAKRGTVPKVIPKVAGQPASFFVNADYINEKPEAQMHQ
jgi:hypothetical protein